MELIRIFIHRLVLAFCLIWYCLDVSGQQVVVPKSTDVIVLRGKSYYLHTVQAGQTLFSICKTYEVDVETVKKLNDKQDNSLSLYEVLKIPYVEPFVQQDSKYHYHKVQKGETLYSIARTYGIKPKQVIKNNSEYANRPLAVGNIVKLPLSDITLSEVPEKKSKEHKTQEEISPALTENTLDSISKTEEYFPERLPVDSSFVKVVLLLPLSAQEYPLFRDTLNDSQSIQLSSRSEMFIRLYEGFLFAVDSLKNSGYKVDLHVFDTERNTEKMYQLTQTINHLQPDLILGPVYGSVYKVLADHLENKRIPIIYPLSSRSENFESYPNFVQINASFLTVANQMTTWLESQRHNSNIIYINLIGSSDTDSEKQQFREQVASIEGAQLFPWNIEEIPLDSLRSLLLPDRENIVVLPTAKEAEVSKILPLLSALTDGYRITTLGMPEWQAFTSVDHETFYKLNTKLFTYSYIDYNSDHAKNIAEKYRNFFHSEAGSLVFKAFDMGMYFIELAAKYRERTLDALLYEKRNIGCSKFEFKQIVNGEGKENHGFYIVNFGSDYRLKLEEY